ncbi:BON domain-containing protein [Krasilnikovia cinnamomea]|uniref:BON domain-containing protein n=1 Tax=Krasilnikovia cinnamomea TaxID=349313 RepID=A0A4Q7ZRL8_9ACTN|nr:CBS domain-containing protein [Krasilnikovia cinnamomea]RZU53233.1 BON domain-containing protein [Krasilnikovia cinnamomea]
MKDWTVSDVMTKPVVSAAESDSYRHVVHLLMEHRVSAVPVVDVFRRVTGVVSEADLLRKVEYLGDGKPRLLSGRRERRERAKASAHTARDLMSAPPVVVSYRTSIPAAARIMDQSGVKRLPVVDDLGRLAGVVSRSDLLKVHLRPDQEILYDIETSVMRPFLADDATTISVAVVDGVVTLAGHVDRWSAVDLVARLIRQLPGVVDVHSTVEAAFDDRELITPGALFTIS